MSTKAVNTNSKMSQRCIMTTQENPKKKKTKQKKKKNNMEIKIINGPNDDGQRKRLVETKEKWASVMGCLHSSRRRESVIYNTTPEKKTFHIVKHVELYKSKNISLLFFVFFSYILFLMSVCI